MNDIILLSSKEDLVHYLKDSVTGDYNSPEADFTRLTENQDGSFTLTNQYGDSQQFNAQGIQIARIDRNQNTTTYQYAASKLDQIIDPLGQITQLTYTLK